MKNLYLPILLIFLSPCCYGQYIMQDSRGKDVLEYYKTGALQATFVPSQISTQLNYNFPVSRSFFYILENGNKDTVRTIASSVAFSLVGKVAGTGSTEGKPFNVNTGLKRPSFRLELGLQRNIDTFFNVSKIPKGNKFTHTVGFNIYGEYQNVNFYDTISSLQSNKRPFNYGLHTHITWYRTRGFRTIAWAFSLSADYSKTYNQDALIPYQENGRGTFIDPNVISVGEVVGQIGSFAKKNAFRLRASFPIFLGPYVNVTPYASVYGYGGLQENWMPGIAFNFLNGSPVAKSTTIAQGFGFGIDWVKSKAKWSSPYYSLYGSLNLDLMHKKLLANKNNDRNY